MTKKSISDEEVFYPEGIDITVASEKFNIKPFVLKNRMVVLKIIGEAISDYNFKQKEIKDLTQADMVSLLIKVAGDRLVGIYEVVLKKEKTWLEDNITIKDEFKIIKAVLEVNDINFLLRQAKSLTSRVKA